MNKKIRKIMACVDFSEYALMVLEYAAELSQNSDIQIVIFNVINQRDVDTIEIFSGYAPANIKVKDYIRDLKQDRQSMIEKMIDEHFFEEKSRMSFMIDVGIPYDKIIKTVEANDIDLVVIANKGRGNLARVLFGSTAEKVFRHSPVPVVSVRDRKRFKRGD
ncbi:MAG: universal stress protein [Pseudomonadota bacterium]